MKGKSCLPLEYFFCTIALQPVDSFLSGDCDCLENYLNRVMLLLRSKLIKYNSSY